MTFLYYLSVVAILYIPLRSDRIKILLYSFLGLLIYVLRDPYAAVDANNYISFYTDYVDDLGAEPSFLWLASLIQFLSFSPVASYYLASALLPLSISLCSLKSKNFLPLALFYASEYFPLLTFNAHRQGIALGLIIFALLPLVNHKTLTPFIKRKNVNDPKVKAANLFGFVSLSFAFLGHSSASVFIIISGVAYCVPRILHGIHIFVKRMRASLLYLKAIPFIFLTLYLVIILVAPRLSELFNLYLNRNELHGSGLAGSFYRLLISSAFLIFTLINSKKCNYVDHAKIRYFVYLSLLTQIFIALILFASMQTFVRLSYFSYLFSIVALLSIPRSSSSFSPAKVIILFVALVSSISDAVVSNLGI